MNFVLKIRENFFQPFKFLVDILNFQRFWKLIFYYFIFKSFSIKLFFKILYLRFQLKVREKMYISEFITFRSFQSLTSSFYEEVYISKFSNTLYILCISFLSYPEMQNCKIWYLHQNCRELRKITGILPKNLLKISKIFCVFYVSKIDLWEKIKQIYIFT